VKVYRKPEILDAQQWDGSTETARELGLVLLDDQIVRGRRSWYLPTNDGPDRIVIGDWVLTAPTGARTVVRREAMFSLYEVAP